MPARPGLNPLRFDTITTVTPERLPDAAADSAEVNGAAGTAGTAGRCRSTSSGAASSPARRPGVRTEPPTRRTSTEIAAVVKSASGLADYTIVTIHAHEGGRERLLPADFLVDVRARDGRRRAPTCSSDMDRTCCAASKSTRASRFSTAWATSSSRTKHCCGCRARTTSRYRPRRRPARQRFQRRALQLRQERFPCRSDDLGGRRRGAEVPRRAARRSWRCIRSRSASASHAAVRGRPLFAEGELGQKILGDITKLSAEMGTKITMRNGIGYVDIAPRQSNQ